MTIQRRGPEDEEAVLEVGHGSTIRKVGHDRGYPCVVFSQPLPIPMNTIPLWVWVPVLLWVSTGGPVLLRVLNN